MNATVQPALSALIAFVISSLSVSGQNLSRPDTTFNYLRPDSLKTSVRYSRVLLKHHFLCACLEGNQVTAKAFAHDYSQSGYLERLAGTYAEEGLDKLLAYEKSVVQAAGFSGKKLQSEHDSSGDIFFRCMKHYEGPELDAFTRSLDLYFLFPRK